MEIWGVGCWRNEADLARVNVLHHLSQGIDRLLIADNGSSDGTAEELQRLARRHPLDYRRLDGPFLQAEILTALAGEAVGRGAAWVVPIDADEFWHAPGSSLREVLAGAEADALRVRVVTFVQQREPGDRSGPASLLTMTHAAPPHRGDHAESVALVERGQIAFVQYPYPPKFVARAAPDLAFDWGSHGLVGTRVAVRDTEAIVCLHAALRSEAVLHAKIDRDRPEDELSAYLGRAWHVARWRRLPKDALAAEWQANSHVDGLLEIGGRRVPLAPDDRLRALVAPWIDAAPPLEPSGARPVLDDAVRVWGVAIVRNEADVIAATIRHHLSLGLDHILVVDNGSDDATAAVLQTLATADRRVEWRHDPGAFQQDAVVTALAREAFARGATWVLPFDADEFWWVAPPVSLRECLAQPDVSALRCEVVNFVQEAEAGASGPESLLTMTRRAAAPVGPPALARALVERRAIGYVEAEYPRKWVFRASPHLTVARGAHDVSGLVGRVIHTSRLACLHAPLRSRAVLDGKVGHGARLDAQALPDDIGWHVRRWRWMEANGGLDPEWRANSHRDGWLDLGAQRRPRLVVDRRLAEAVRAATEIGQPAAAGPRPGPEPPALTDIEHAEVLAMMAGIEGWLTPDEARLLARIAADASGQWPSRPLVEVGSYLGRSTVVLAAAARLRNPAATVFAVDPHAGVTGAADSAIGLAARSNTLAAFQAHVTARGLGANVRPLALASYEVPWGRAIGLLFVDGLHDFDSVRTDLAHFEPWLVPDGYLALHDARGPFPGVARALDALMASGRFDRHAEADSLTVLRKRGWER